MANSKRLLAVEIDNFDDVARLRTRLDMCCLKYKLIKDNRFVGGAPYWTFYIDRGKLHWEQILREVNRDKKMKTKYVSMNNVKF